MKLLRKATGIGALVLTLLGCSSQNAPSQIRTSGSHFGSMMMVAKSYHKGVKRFGNDLDIDGDNMNDLYVICNDGTVYHTMSRRLVQGEDSAKERNWYRNDLKAIKSAHKGDYKSL